MGQECSIGCCTTSASRQGGNSIALEAVLQRIGSQFDPAKVLGAKVTVGSWELSAWNSQLVLRDIVVENPLEGKWESPYLMKMDHLLVRINAQRLLGSFGGELEVMEVVSDGMDAIYEPSFAGSNVGTVQRHMQKRKEEKLRRQATLMSRASSKGPMSTISGGPSDLSKKSSARLVSNIEPPTEEEPPKAQPTQIILRRVSITNMSAMVWMHKDLGQRIGLPDIEFVDFYHETDSDGQFNSIVKTMMNTLIQGMKDQVRRSGSQLCAESCTGCCTGCWAGCVDASTCCSCSCSRPEGCCSCSRMDARTLELHSAQQDWAKMVVPDDDSDAHPDKPRTTVWMKNHEIEIIGQEAFVKS